MSYLLLVDYDFPPELRDHLDWAPARMKVGKGLCGPHTADMAERLGLSPSPCEKLAPFLNKGVDGKRLKFLRGVPWAPGSGGCTGPTASPAAPSWRASWRSSGTRTPTWTRPSSSGPCDELRAPDQRLGGVPGLRGDAQDGPQQGLHERAHPSRRPHAAALQAHDGEGLLPPHEEALPEDEAADTDSVMVQIFEPWPASPRTPRGT